MSGCQIFAGWESYQLVLCKILLSGTPQQMRISSLERYHVALQMNVIYEQQLYSAGSGGKRRLYTHLRNPSAKMYSQKLLRSAS